MTDDELTKGIELADVRNRAEIEEMHRGMNLTDLEDIFKRLGIDKKREELEPVMEEARLWIRQGSMPYADRRILRKLVEFIECLDEP